ncbi:hypothetical protein HID58_035306 [Brassica napus]|uniref:F-box associated beta-propeller type 1 domain-containing protein n=1 Tax=Brassica napus TaxID=3708 RepID=A0ABQ8C4K8_BRANA|nr:hypothetical protein HID58_035306 [Brassica napus]
MIKYFKMCSLRFDVHEEFTISEVFVCDGLSLCVTVTRDEYSQRLMLWNPYLGQTRWIQPIRRAYDRSDVYALGYDKSTNRNHEDEFEIYDVKSDSWRTLDVKLHWGWGEDAHVYVHVRDETFCVQDEFVEGDLTSFADMKRVWLSRKFSYVYEALPSSNLSLLSHAIVDANDKGVEIATAGGETNA